MPDLTITAKGQITLKKEILLHLGLKPGEKIELDLLPGGTGIIKAANQRGKIDEFIGLLSSKTSKIASIEEINEVISNSWAGK
jgi:bifunctional DNA-binding transcriptional regulator/antitoxin component of YhaV-PrlF toxin-antitoxin module